MTKQDKADGRQRETKKYKYDETKSSRMEIKGDKPGNHDKTNSNRREIKGDKPGNHDETGSNRRRQA